MRADYASGVPVQRLIGQWCAAIDAVVVSAWARSVGASGEIGLSLLATGGYGRGEMYPLSDIDLLVLAEARVQKRAEAALARFWALLWDAGLAAGHAVRSLAQCVDAARADIATLTSMMELRTLAGDDAARAALAAALAPAKLWPPAEYFQSQARRTASRATPASTTPPTTSSPTSRKVPAGCATCTRSPGWACACTASAACARWCRWACWARTNAPRSSSAGAELARLRFGLHLVAARREERLLFDHQKALAALLGLQDEHATTSPSSR